MSKLTCRFCGADIGDTYPGVIIQLSLFEEDVAWCSSEHYRKDQKK